MMEKTNLNTLASEVIRQSSNPLGIDFDLKRYTKYSGVRLEPRKRRPDKLIFLERFRGHGHRFRRPVFHTTKEVFFYATRYARGALLK
jgi:hypothetical protein